MTRRLVMTAAAGAAAAVAVATSPLTAHATSSGHRSAGAAAKHHSSTAVATASFHGSKVLKHLKGTSRFTQGTNAIIVHGSYSGLHHGQWYFTVVYANDRCDPAQAFVAGPFRSDSHGKATLETAYPVEANIAGTLSMSVRRADNGHDIDHDDKRGPSDVVAVPGRPKVGLQECDRHPVITIHP